MARTASAWWRRKWRGEVPHADVPDGPVDDPWAAVDGSAAMRTALMRLQVRQRAVLVLRFVADMSEAETGAALGWPLGTVKSTTARALGALRAAGMVESEAQS
jgi:RNA polymerase sigma factor (sigma-70 family)